MKGGRRRTRRAPPAPGRAMGTALAAQIAAILPVFLIGSLGPLIMADLAMTPFAFGLLVASFYGAAAFASIVLAPRADRAGVWRLVAIALAGTAVVVMGIGLGGRSVAALFVLIVAAGLANGTVQPATNVVVARHVPPGRQGFAFGLKQSAIPVATLLGGASVPIVGETIGWRWSFTLATILPVLVALTAPGDGPARDRMSGGGGALPPRPLLFALAATMGMGAACANAMAAFVAASIVEAGHTPAEAGIAIVLGSLASVAVRISLGLAADRWSLPLLRIAAVLLLAGAISHVLLALSGALWILAAATVAAFCLGWGWSGILLLAVMRSAPGAVGRATGTTHSGVFIGAVLGPLGFGWIAGWLGYPAAWIALAALGTAAALLAALVSVRLSRYAPAAAGAPATGAAAAGVPGRATGE